MALRLAAIKCKIAVVDIERHAAKQTVAEIIKNNGTAVAYCVSIFYLIYWVYDQLMTCQISPIHHLDGYNR